jgi:hypothetical protein
MNPTERLVVAYLAGVATLPVVVWGVCRFDRWRAGRSDDSR